MTVQTAPEHVSALLTVGEVMAELHCSESTVRRLIGSGELAAVRIGTARAIRVPRSSLDALLEPVEPGAHEQGNGGVGGSRPPPARRRLAAPPLPDTDRKDTVTTATRPKVDPLAELEAREQAYAEAKAEASRIGSEWGDKSRQLQALHDQRARLIHPRYGDPALVDHTGNPNPDVKDNPVAVIDAQVAELGDLGDLEARVHHARQLEQSAKQAQDDYTAAHFDELRVAAEPEADAVSAEIARLMAQIGEAGTVYLNLARRVDGWKGTDRTRQRQRVPAIDTASDLVRMAQDYGTPPLATELR